MPVMMPETRDAAVEQEVTPAPTGAGHLVLRSDLDSTEEMVIAQIEAADLGQCPRTNYPIAGALTVHIEDPIDGDRDEKQQEIIGLGVRQHRRYYERPIEETGGGTPPDCSAPDGVTGDRGECAGCEYSKFKSARNGKGKACKELIDVYHFVKGEAMPRIITLPPTSGSGYAKYDVALKSHALPLHGVITRLSFAPATSGAFKYAVAELKMVRRLTPEELRFTARCAAIVQAKIANMITALKDANK